MSLDEDIEKLNVKVEKVARKIASHYNTGYVGIMTEYIELAETVRIGYFVTYKTLPNKEHELEIGTKCLDVMIKKYQGDGTK